MSRSGPQHILTAARSLLVHEFLLELLHAGPALHCRLMLARQGLAWHFSQLPNLRSASQKLVWVSFHTLSPPSAPQGLCLSLAPWACLLCCRGLCGSASVSSLGQPSASRFVCSSWPPWPPLCAAGLLCTSWLPEPVVWSGSGSVSYLWAEKCSSLNSAL